MKKAIIIGVACLTVGIGLAGCGASNSSQPTETTTAETTTTATTQETTTTTETQTTTTTEAPTTTTTTESPTTTTTEAPTTVAEEDVFYLDGERFTGVYLDVGNGTFTGFGDFPPGTVYVNGVKYTGSIDDFPESFNFVVEGNNYGRSDTTMQKSITITGLTPCFLNGAPITARILPESQEAHIYLKKENFTEGFDATLNIDGNNYSAKVEEDSDGWEAVITLDKTYESGHPYTLTVSCGDYTATGKGTVE